LLVIRIWVLLVVGLVLVWAREEKRVVGRSEW
jgi:hypothetical protein